jgi:CHASE2 domain-containing sensor protein
MDENRIQNIVVTDIQMPFMSMVIFMVKWVIAAIPAMLILTMLGTLFMSIFSNFAGR